MWYEISSKKNECDIECPAEINEQSPSERLTAKHTSNVQCRVATMSRIHNMSWIVTLSRWLAQNESWICVFYWRWWADPTGLSSELCSA